MCGIFAQINKKKQGKFNFPAFATLGVANDFRGGDSCGIFIDGKVEYGVDKQKLFSDFMKTSKLLNNTNKCHIALGHCRKASVGNISLETAQPVIIKENNEIKFVVIHNGTIYNYEQLAKKYIPEINIKGMTDSQVMTQIFYHKGYDCLNEYNGGAVFVIVDYRTVEPTILCFKGKSKQYASSSIATDERPFYFMTTHGSLYISSLYHWLVPFANGEQVYTITENQLIQINNNLELTIYQEIDRSKCIQTKESQQIQQHTDPYYNYDQQYTPLNSCQSKNYLGKRASVNQAGIYKCDDEVLHGSYYIQPTGKIGYSTEATYLHFWNGVLLKNYQCYQFLEKFAKTANLDPIELCYTIPQTLNYLSFYPFMDEENDYKLYTYLTLTEKVPYNGQIHWISEDCLYVCVDGQCEDCIPVESNKVFKDLYTDNIHFYFNPTDLYNHIIKETNK
jgi:predicted glutamine amidotransferase